MGHFIHWGCEADPRAAGAEFAVEFEHIGFWDPRFAVADSDRNGRVFLAGDAAHSHPPYGGLTKPMPQIAQMERFRPYWLSV
jgi:hypothetical protein